MNKQDSFKKEMFDAGFEIELDKFTRKPTVQVSHSELQDLLKIMVLAEIECEVKKYSRYCVVSPKCI